MGMRRSARFLAFVGVCALLLALAWVHSLAVQRNDAGSISQKREMVKRLGIGDLCLFTDARYTRHPTSADVNTPFQDYPLSLEHFPSGSLMPVPPHLRPKARE